MKNLHKIILIILVMCTLITSVTYANDDKVPASINQVERVKEITELRDATSKVYLMEDGTYQYVGYADDIHYEECGEYKEINNSLTTLSEKVNGIEYKYRNTANYFDVLFADSDKTKFPVAIKLDDYSLEFGLDNMPKVKAEKNQLIKSDILNGIVDKDSTVLYSDIKDGIDLLYEASTHGVKEYIILNKQPSSNTFEFNAKFDGVTPKQKGNGIVFVNNKGESIFEIADLYAIDNNGEICDDVKCEYSKTDEGYKIILTVNKEYLFDSSRAYPIVVDPTVLISSSSTADTFVGSKEPERNFNSGSNMAYLRTGRDADYYIRRTYIKFNIPSSIPYNTVSSAYLTLRKSSGSEPSIRAYRVINSWSSNTITWNNKAAYDSATATANAFNFSQYGSNLWYKINVTDIVKSWCNGIHNNYGFMIKDDTESGTSQWTTFYSSDASSPNKPELIINYDSTPRRYAYSIGINDNGDDFTPNVIFAKDMYATISTMTGSYLSTSPDVTYMKGNNPNGYRRIASNVVFLNGHACPTFMSFDITGVVSGNDTSDYVGLSSTNMKHVELISFVGCRTGAGDINLCSTAISQGAKTAVGFTDEVHSRIDEGRLWLRYYNSSLAAGNSVAHSAAFAIALVPHSSLSQHVIIYGNPYTVIAPAAKSSTTDLEFIKKELDPNTPISAIDKNEITADIKEQIKSLDGTFDASKYKASLVNVTDSISYLILNYYIDDIIQTNKAFVVILQDGYATEILFKNRNIKGDISEKELLERIANFNKKDISSKLKNIADYSERYLFDYDDNSLCHEVFFIKELKIDDHIVYADETIKTVID